MTSTNSPTFEHCMKLCGKNLQGGDNITQKSRQLLEVLCHKHHSWFLKLKTSSSEMQLDVHALMKNLMYRFLESKGFRGEHEPKWEQM